MNTEVMDRVEGILRELATQLGTTVEHVYGVLIDQVYVEALQSGFY